MSKLDDIERLARTSERLTILTPFTTLQLIEVVREAARMRRALAVHGLALSCLPAFDAAMSALEDRKQP